MRAAGSWEGNELSKTPYNFNNTTRECLSHVRAAREVDISFSFMAGHFLKIILVHYDCLACISTALVDFTRRAT